MATATAVPAHRSMGRSFVMSPYATARQAGSPARRPSRPSAVAFVTPDRVISQKSAEDTVTSTVSSTAAATSGQ